MNGISVTKAFFGIIVKLKVGQHPHINVTDNDDMGAVGCVALMGNDELLREIYVRKPFKMSGTGTGRKQEIPKTERYFPFITAAKNNLIRQLIEVIASKFYSSTPEGQSELCGRSFKIEYSEKRRRFVYVRIYSGTLHLRDVIRISEKREK